MAAQAVSVVEQQDPALQHLVAGYRPLPGVFDEMMDAEGRVRPHWHPFLSMLAALGGEEINRRLLKAIFKTTPYKILEAHRASEATALLESETMPEMTPRVSWAAAG